MADKTTLDERQILNYVGNELNYSAGGNENDFIDANRKAALGMYLGQPNGKEVEGKSQVTSTDVADAIEWIMPEIVKAFTQNNEVVTFDADYQGDEDQAEMESQYVYDILMKENDGFIVLHTFIKDALMQKNGFIKVFYEKDEVVTKESYTGLTMQEFAAVVSDPDIEPIEITEYVDGDVDLIDAKFNRTVDNSGVRVVCVPPEEFRVNKQHNSISLADCRFSAHVMLKTAGDLVDDGYDKAFVDSIPSSNVYEDDREYRFYMQDETVQPDRNNSLDPSLRTIEVAECYMMMDIDGDGIAELCKVTVAGGDSPDVLLDIEEIDSNPFISATAILMSHKLFGLSIYDRLKEIQEQKTTLWRNIFDNMYLQNNQRTIAVESLVNLDDLMVSRPGGIIRAKRIDAVAPYVTPPLPGDTYKMMDYLDVVRTGRSGVSPEGAVTDNMIGDRVGSEGVEKMLTQKEELVGLMIRVFAETGIKPLCYKIRNEVIKHQDVAKAYKYRGKWVDIKPTQWRNRTHTTVRVGTGSGNRQQQSGAIGQVMMLQEKMQSMPGQAMVRPNEMFASINDFCKMNGLSSASPYFLDPKSPEGKQHAKEVGEKQQKQQDEQKQQEMALAQAQVKLVEVEGQKAQITGQKNQAEAMLKQEEIKNKGQVDMLTQKLKEAETVIQAQGKGEELDYKYWDSAEKHDIAREQIQSQAQMAKDNNNSKPAGDEK